MELGKRWWHRLAVVGFVVVLGITLLVTWAGMMADTEPTNTDFDQSCHVVDLPAPPPVTADPYAAYGGTTIPLGEKVPGEIVPIHYEVLMPDWKTREFVGKSRDEIRTEWDATLHELKVREWLLSPVVAILVMLAMSYLLQSLYRALLYVVYGSQKSVTV